MRILIVISNDLFVRNFVSSGAFAELDGPETFYIASDSVAHKQDLERLPNLVGTVAEPPGREDVYAWIRAILMAGMRFRSRTARVKTGQMPARTRIPAKFVALPGIRGARVARLLRRIGRNPGLERVLDEVRPDLIVAPTAGTDALVLDAVQSGRERGIPTLLLVSGWDNLSSKLTFSILPDWLGVWGEQSIEHAVKLHDMPRERVFPMGTPTFQRYFDFDRAASTPPYDFPYVLFAGCALPFDERTALIELDRAVEASGVEGLKIVYRPHPWRIKRDRPDYIDEGELANVVIDRQMRAAYERSKGVRALSPAEELPELDYYPSLVGNARFVVCPLSTMTVESALLDRRVLVLAYDDGVHDVPPSVAATFDHFQGIDRVRGFHFCRRLEDLRDDFVEVAAEQDELNVRDEVRHWLHFDEDSYGRRLRKLVDRLAPDVEQRAQARGRELEPVAG
jgi:hypothetical protein